MNQQSKSLVMNTDKVPGSLLNDCVCRHHLRTLHSRVWKCTILELCWLTNLGSITYLVCRLGQISSSHYISFFLSVKHDKSFYIRSPMGLTNIKQRNHIISSLNHGSYWINAGISLQLRAVVFKLDICPSKGCMEIEFQAKWSDITCCVYTVLSDVCYYRPIISIIPFCSQNVLV